jgi:transcriptional regulator with XRE-family HTH domain
MTVHERIRELRRALQLSQPAFAAKIRISKGYIALLELGKKPVNGRVIRLISAAFNASERWLETGDGPMFHGSSDRKLDELGRIFRNLNPFFQDFFLEQMRKVYDYERESGDRAESGK